MIYARNENTIESDIDIMVLVNEDVLREGITSSAFCFVAGVVLNTAFP